MKEAFPGLWKAMAEYVKPSKAQMKLESLTLDENGMDTAAPCYIDGRTHDKKAYDKHRYDNNMGSAAYEPTGIPRWLGNWKGGISLDKKAYDAKRYRDRQNAR